MRLLLESLPYVILMFTYQNLAGYYVCLLSFRQGKALKKLAKRNKTGRKKRNCEVSVANCLTKIFSSKVSNHWSSQNNNLKGAVLIWGSLYFDNSWQHWKNVDFFDAEILKIVNEVILEQRMIQTKNSKCRTLFCTLQNLCEFNFVIY